MGSVDDRRKLTDWAADVQERAYTHWQENHADYNPGMKVFCSPVFENPRLLFVGFQPGGTSFGSLQDQFESGDFTPPSEHEFLTEAWDLAKTMQNKLFDGETGLIENSVALNHVFYRAPSQSEWRDVSEENRDDMESFSIATTVDVIQKLEPDNILFFGMKTWHNMQDELGFSTGREVDRIGYRDGDKLVRFSPESSPQHIGIVHPTTRHGPSNEEFNKAKQAILEEIE
jgi:hypothetical protein